MESEMNSCASGRVAEYFVGVEAGCMCVCVCACVGGGLTERKILRQRQMRLSGGETSLCLQYEIVLFDSIPAELRRTSPPP